MPPRKKKIHNRSAELYESAMILLQSGHSLRRVSRELSIPASTLHDHMNGKYKGRHSLPLAWRCSSNEEIQSGSPSMDSQKSSPEKFPAEEEQQADGGHCEQSKTEICGDQAKTEVCDDQLLLVEGVANDAASVDTTPINEICSEDSLTVKEGNDDITTDTKENLGIETLEDASTDSTEENVSDVDVLFHVGKSSNNSGCSAMGKRAKRNQSNKNKFICKTCSKVFTYEKSFQTHQCRNNEFCNLCQKSFATSRSFATHRCFKVVVSHPCEHCGREFPTLPRLEKHVKVTTKCESYSCELCDHMASSLCALRLHKKSHVRSSGTIPRARKFLCSICSKAFTSSSQLRVHMRCHTGEKPFPCDLCDRAFSTKSAMKVHRRQHTGEKPYKCEECGCGFISACSRQLHVKRVTKKAEYLCEVCNINFTALCSLQVHNSDCHSEVEEEKRSTAATLANLPRRRARKFPCTICHKLFICNGHLVEHLRVHTGERPFTCDICGKTFTTKSSMTTHRHIHSDSPPIRCPVCNRGFYQKCSLNSHMVTHTKEKLYQCTICGKRLSVYSSYKDHMAIHSGIRRHICSMCGRDFIHRSSLQLHERIHRGEKRYACEMCDCRFTALLTLKNHRRVHTGEKPFECQQCQMKFSQLSSLLRHRQSKHETTRKFQCHECFKSFVTRDGLKDHSRVHTGEKPYKCAMCNSRFAHRSQFLQHKASHIAEGVVDCGITV